MIAVVIGDMDRDTLSDKEQVLSLLEHLRNKHRDLTIVSAACERGIGRFVIDHCLDKTKELFSFIEVAMKIWRVYDKAKLSQFYISRNPTLLALGEVFYVFSSGWRMGYVADLIEKVKQAGLPLTVFNKNGTIELFNMKEESSV